MPPAAMRAGSGCGLQGPASLSEYRVHGSVRLRTAPGEPATDADSRPVSVPARADESEGFHRAQEEREGRREARAGKIRYRLRLWADAAEPKYRLELGAPVEHSHLRSNLLEGRARRKDGGQCCACPAREFLLYRYRNHDKAEGSRS